MVEAKRLGRQVTFLRYLPIGTFCFHLAHLSLRSRPSGSQVRVPDSALEKSAELVVVIATMIVPLYHVRIWGNVVRALELTIWADASD